MKLDFKPTKNPAISECVVGTAMLQIKKTDAGYVATARRLPQPTPDKTVVMRTLNSHAAAAEWLENVVNKTWF